MTVKVTGESTLSIDACHYRVLIIDRTFDGGSIHRTFLAPDLMFPIKLQSQVDGAFRTDTEYSAIDRSVVPAPQ
jgi:hypothetical protein